MIWLASYPRSGNTFFRIVLDEAYSIKSSKFHPNSKKEIDPSYGDAKVVKTHALPGELVPSDPTIAAVYLYRDGRDCAVSMARRHKDFVDPNSDYETNLREAIIGPGGDHAGHWTEHVQQWRQRSTIHFRFEEVISNPIGCIEQLRPYVDLPVPKPEKVPTFQDLKTRDFSYGAGKSRKLSPDELNIAREKFFRRGKAGSWREEMTPLHQRMFWRFHGPTLIQLGYETGESEELAKKRILIDVSSLTNGKRLELAGIFQALAASATPDRNWEVDIYAGGGEIHRLTEIPADLFTQASQGFLSKLLRRTVRQNESAQVDFDSYDLIHTSEPLGKTSFKDARTKVLCANIFENAEETWKRYEAEIYHDFIHLGLYPFAKPPLTSDIQQTSIPIVSGTNSIRCIKA